MNWLKLKLRSWINSAQDISENEYVSMKMASANSISIGRGPSLDSDKGIRFQVYKANGGMVVETSMYDRHKDRHHNSLHIINDEQDLGKELAKIITMETLKQ
jgi:hypothetical protein